MIPIKAGMTRGDVAIVISLKSKSIYKFLFDILFKNIKISFVFTNKFCYEYTVFIDFGFDFIFPNFDLGL